MSEPKIASSASVMVARLIVILTPILLVVTLGLNTEHLLLGWIYFPLQTIPKMTMDWASAMIGLAAMVLFVVGLHRTACWFMHRGDSVNVIGTRSWTWRSTVVCSGLLFVLFASGTALVGATHQLVWLSSGRITSNAVANEYPGLMEQARDAARRSQVRNELRMFGLAFHNFHDVHGAFPPGGTVNQDGGLLHGWAMSVGPYVSYVASDEIDFRRGWKDPSNKRGYKCQLSCFINPSLPGPVFDEDGFGLCHWAGNVHVLPIRTVDVDTPTIGVDRHRGGISIKHITDGTSNTILLGTVGQHFKPWGHPANVRDPAVGVNRSPEGFGGPPAWQGGHFAMCDGSVRFLSDDTDLSIMKALATPAGGEPVLGQNQ